MVDHDQTSSFEESSKENDGVSIHCRKILVSVIKMLRVYKATSPKMTEFFPLSQNLSYNIRQQSDFS